MKYLWDRVIKVKCDRCGHEFEINLKGRRVSMDGYVVVRCKKCRSFIDVPVLIG